MITLHGEEVKIGDTVWHWFKGWGEVIGLDDESTSYPILVRWAGSEEWFTEDGRYHTVDMTPVLFWRPIVVEIPKKPKQTEKAWQWVCRGGDLDAYWLTHCYYVSKEDVLERNSNVEPIEPYLPSEIEREVKE